MQEQSPVFLPASAGTWVNTGLVRHRVGFTGGLIWTGFGFRVVFGFQIGFCGSKPVQIGSWGRKRPREAI